MKHWYMVYGREGKSVYVPENQHKKKSKEGRQVN